MDAMSLIRRGVRVATGVATVWVAVASAIESAVEANAVQAEEHPRQAEGGAQDSNIEEE